MDIGSSDENMDAGIFRLLDCLEGTGDISLLGSCQTENPGSLHFLTNAHHGVEIALRRRRETRFDDIDAELLELPGNNNLLLTCHACSRRLFAIPKRGIKNSHDIVICHCLRHGFPPLLINSFKNKNSRGNADGSFFALRDGELWIDFSHLPSLLPPAFARRQTP